MFPARRATFQLSRQLRTFSRPLSATAAFRVTSETNAVAEKNEAATPQTADNAAPVEVTQAPNRTGIWSRSQKPRAEAMTGPRFEQINFDKQPQPHSAMALIHEQPVRWVHERVVACDGGGGPAGHPRVFINTDKPEITPCGYCGLPFANEHNRKHLESLPETSYPLA
ncbi:lactobacillus shifted protein [Plectosphaerella plurivora]|uniref:Lactobacillus shifted protein n=1 Tax=Plectosphaerella plurivora TaxID=936078 RepID=A0A9P9AC34_9PEZI|nr:lactobacillus shifted protein [Plectosphaerella plurivora]